VGGVRFGLTAFCTDRSATPAEVAAAAEADGFAVLLFPDHTHVPVSRRVAFPGGGDLPEHYCRTLDPLIASAWAISATTRLTVGIGVCLVPAREPIALAKQVASLDVMAGGRFVLGVGAGWNGDEIADHGVAPVDRWAVLRERVLAMKAIWSDDEASFHGEHVSFDALWSWPKPVRPGGPPIIVGGHGDGVLARVLEYGDEWLVMPAPGRPPLAERIATLWSEADRRGRARPTISCQLYGELRPELVERLAGAGVGRIDLAVAHGSAAQVQDEIGRLGELVAGWRKVEVVCP
jgi:probable F420-dependent oxidoreductase